MLPDALESAIERATGQGRKPKLIYTIPTYQNPQGWTMTLERRQVMVEGRQPARGSHPRGRLLRRSEAGRARVRRLRSIRSTRTGSVMYVASFSKIIAPGMRIGYGTGPSEVLDRALVAKSGGSVNSFAVLCRAQVLDGAAGLAHRGDQRHPAGQTRRDACVAR